MFALVDCFSQATHRSLIGCSFSFEEPLIAAGIPIRHIVRGCNVSMYRTNVPTTPAGRFCGPLVVSMRPLKPADAIRAVQITSRLPAVHGTPVHIGLPESIGIADLAKPEFGDAVPIKPDELPVFWACGVAPQAAIAAARPPSAITHALGCMLVSDLKNAQLAAMGQWGNLGIAPLMAANRRGLDDLYR